MTIIGITGFSGSGKTTLSENLFRDKNVEIYHLDHIFDGIKNLMPGFLMSRITRDSGEVVQILDRSRATSALFSTDFVSAIKWLYARWYLQLSINKAQKDNIDYFIIEGMMLENCIKLDDLDYRIVVRAPHGLRNERILKRNGEGEINCVDITVRFDLPKYDIIVDNDQTLEEFLAKIADIEQDISRRNTPRFRTDY